MHRSLGSIDEKDYDILVSPDIRTYFDALEEVKEF